MAEEEDEDDAENAQRARGRERSEKKEREKMGGENGAEKTGPDLNVFFLERRLLAQLLDAHGARSRVSTLAPTNPHVSTSADTKIPMQVSAWIPKQKAHHDPVSAPRMRESR